jgi:hypothetical protein
MNAPVVSYICEAGWAPQLNLRPTAAPLFGPAVSAQTRQAAVSPGDQPGCRIAGMVGRRGWAQIFRIKDAVAEQKKVRNFRRSYGLSR